MINTLLVAAFLAWADIMWILYLRHPVPFNARPLTLTLGAETFLYVLFTFIDIDIQVRAQIVRASIIAIAFSMSFPMTLAQRGRKNVH